ncbi:sugar transferase [Sphingomonas sp. MMS12-HWE2-04]|uniref:sugar transferase n=1 Tax=Sphingomonas sp. MMS12-HWE2-04 TaxID=3234199 RepID=UPI00384AD0B1
MDYYVHTRYSRWHRLRVQAAGAIVIPLLPYVARLVSVWDTPLSLAGGADSVSVLHLTFVLSLGSVLAGTMIMRSMARYPGVEGSASILPAFSATFGTVLLFLVMGRIEYNRFVLASSYFLALLWFYFIHFKEQRRGLRIGIISHATLDPAFIGVRRVVPVMLENPDSDVSGLDAIAVDLRVDLPPEWERRLADYALAGLQVLHLKHLVESLTGRVELEHLSETSYGTLSPSSFYLVLKMWGDWIAAAAALAIMSPALILIALMIRVDSPGPAIFRQTRIGYRGKPFTVYKFRTMTDAGSQGEHRTAAMTRDNDARVTKLGRALRQTRIDELPQLVNVLRGEMSWIGPRPEAAVLSRWYESEIPFYRYRHIVRPGITGWAQVSQGHVAEIADVTSKLHYDFYYIKNFSPWLDLLIVARTIRTMATGFGAR